MYAIVIHQIKVEECFWTLEDRKMIIVHLEKVSIAAVHVHIGLLHDDG